MISQVCSDTVKGKMDTRNTDLLNEASQHPKLKEFVCALISKLNTDDDNQQLSEVLDILLKYSPDEELDNTQKILEILSLGDE